MACGSGIETRSRICLFNDASNEESLVDERSCSFAENIWYGESELATISNDAGIWEGDFELSNIFDNDASTSWHSGYASMRREKIITIDFHVRVYYGFTYNII